jgi:hypothetical protein
MPVTDLFSHLENNKRDRLCSVPHPNGHGILICGRDAIERFIQLAERHLIAQKVEKKVDLEVFTNAITDELVQRFLKETREIERKSVDRMLSAALKKVKAKHQSLTHFIPCVVVFESDPKEFQIGPVHFIWMEKFLNDKKEEIEKERERIRLDHIRRCEETVADGRPAQEVATPEISSKIANQLVDGLIEYFSDFKWMTTVTVPECDKTVSRERAEIAVEAALDVLKLFLGTSYGTTLRQGHSRGIPRQTANLTHEADGALHISIGWGAKDAMVGPGWFNAITEPDSFYFKAAGTALYACIDPEQSSDLNQRFLDALTWYGQAIWEQMPSAQIIKYVAALERLTVTKKVDDLTKTVSRRTATLLNHGGSKEDFDRSYEKAKKIYDFRSGLMHGSLSPFDKKLMAIAPLAERIARDTLLRSLDLFVSLQYELQNSRPTRLDLEKKYQSLETEFSVD